MTIGKSITASAAIACAAAALFAAHARAGGDNVVFPENLTPAACSTRPSIAPTTNNLRELFVSLAGGDRGRQEGRTHAEPVVTLVQYAALLDANGNPQTRAPMGASSRATVSPTR